MTESEFRTAWIKEQRRAIGQVHHIIDYADYYELSDEVIQPQINLCLDAMDFALIFGWYLTK